MIGSKRERPTGVCSLCCKEKPIVKHLNGDPNTPLCAACNMKMRRKLASNDQVKAIKLGATVIGALEQLLGLDLDRGHEQEILALQARIKILTRVWLGDEPADIVADPFATNRCPNHINKDNADSSSSRRPELSQAQRNEKISAGCRAYWARRRAQQESEQ
jgi:hypothetical protein